MSEFLSCVRSGSAQQVIALVDQYDQSSIDSSVLQAFLGNCRSILGDFDIPSHGKWIHRYSIGRRVELMTTTIVADQLSVPVELVTQYGKLKSFRFRSDQLRSFVEHLEDTTSAKDFAMEFVEQWLTAPAESSIDAELSSQLISDLRSEDVRLQLQEMRIELLEDFAGFQSVADVTLERDPQSNSLDLELTAKFRNGECGLSISVELDAVSMRISRIELKR